MERSEYGSIILDLEEAEISSGASSRSSTTCRTSGIGTRSELLLGSLWNGLLHSPVTGRHTFNHVAHVR